MSKIISYIISGIVAIWAAINIAPAAYRLQYCIWNPCNISSDYSSRLLIGFFLGITLLWAAGAIFIEAERDNHE
jgi:hypothetical protein